jgi:hypothetical protein
MQCVACDIYMFTPAGSSLSQLEESCGIDTFIDLFRTSLVAVYDLEDSEVGDISVFELNAAGA